MGLRLWGFAYLGCGYRPSMQYIPQKNIKSATAAFADSLLIVCYELSHPHFMERRGSLYFSSEHTAYSPVNLGYLCEAINDDFISHVRGCKNALPKLTLPRGRFCARTGFNHQVAYLILLYKRACENTFVFHTPFIMLSPMK